MMPSCDQIGVPIHLPLLDDVRVCFVDELAHSAEGFPAPVPELGDSFRDELRCRLALARARLFHDPILEVPESVVDMKAYAQRPARSPRAAARRARLAGRSGMWR